MSENNHKNDFVSHFRVAAEQHTLQKLTLSKPAKGQIASENGAWLNVYARLVQLKNDVAIQFTLHYEFRDVTKNYTPKEAAFFLNDWLGNDFKTANLMTDNDNFIIQYSKKDKISMVKTKNKSILNNKNQINTDRTNDIDENDKKTNISTNDIVKKRKITTENNIWLQKLGVLSENGLIFKEKQSKFKQIDKYLEIIDHTLPNDLLQQENIKIADMGAGKGYLTFALHDFLQQKNKKFTHQNIQTIGIEFRADLVEKCNDIAKSSALSGLHFEQNTIEQANVNDVDVLIALHACDTATDDAILKGLAAEAHVIIVAPCCHKQVRKAMLPSGSLAAMLKNGIQMERQAELLTDSIRALCLEAHGYNVKVQEFISLEHTGKNILITAVKKPNLGENYSQTAKSQAIFAQIDDLMRTFGVEKHYLINNLKS